jgi:uncharacterized membrane-anchored protein
MRLLAVGETVLLRVVPVDPRDIFRGDYVTLSYDFSRTPEDGIPGLGKYDYDNSQNWCGQTVYITLKPEEDGKHWQKDAITLERPTSGKYLRGEITSPWQISCGIDAFYVQEGEGQKYEDAARNRKLSAEISLTQNGEAGLRTLHIDAKAGTAIHSETAQKQYTYPSNITYRAAHIADGKLEITGRADSPEWAKANVERQFSFPWKKDVAAPPTEFRALYDNEYFYFTFQAEDADIVAVDAMEDKKDIVLEDRVELIFSCDDRMQKYYCLEIDSKGRVYDYSGSFYRNFDSDWKWPGLETKSSTTPNGYIVEGRIPLKSFEELGLRGPKNHYARSNDEMYFGIFRAEFSHDRSGKPVEQHESIHNLGRKLDGPPPVMDWISWIDPKTKEPDFHVPGALGHLELVH